MKVTIKKLSNVEKKLEVIVSEQEIYPIKEKVVRDWQKKAIIPGFRKGKAPLQLVCDNYKKEIEEDLKERIVSLFTPPALEKAGLSPILPPQLNFVEFEEHAVRFSLHVEEVPKVKVKKYKGLKAKRISVSVAKEEVESALEKLKQDRAVWNKVRRPAQKSDMLKIDMVIYEGNKKLDEKKNVAVLLADNFPIPNFVDKLIGINVKEEREFELNLPCDFYDKKLAGKKVRFRVFVKEISVKKEPELNDAFARALGDYQNLEDLREKIAQEIREIKDSRAEEDLENKLLEELIKETEIEIPTGFLQFQTRKIVEDFITRLLFQGIAREEIEKNLERIFKEAREVAIRKIKIYHALEEIVRKEKIEISEDEFEEYLNTLAEERKISAADLKKNIIEANKVAAIKQGLRRKKALQLIVREANIEDGNGGAK